MDVYEKVTVIPGESEEEPPFHDFELPEDRVIWLEVRPSLKTSHLLSMCIGPLKGGDYLIVSAVGQATSRLCHHVEILKQKVNGLHQVTRILYQRSEDLWTPREPGLDTLRVVREVPAMHVLLCKKPEFRKIEEDTGYAAPEKQRRNNDHNRPGDNRRGRTFSNH